MSGDRVATERLWRTADGRVVFDGDAEAVLLIAAEGDVIPDGYDIPKRAGKPADKNVAAPDGGDKSVALGVDKLGDRPAVSATKDEWVAYRQAQGHDVDGLTKADLIDLGD